MEQKDINRKIELLRHGIANLQEHVNSQGHESGENQREELLTALEELHVAQEEMRQQNEQLLAAREALDLERRRYRNLFQSAPYGCAVTDAAGLIQEANHALEALLHFSPQFMVGRPLAEFVAQADQRAFKSHLRKLRQNEPLRDTQIHLQPRTNTPLPVSVNVAVLYDAQGRVLGFQWTFADLTEQQTAEKMRLQRAMLQGQLEREKVQLTLRDEQRIGELKTSLISMLMEELRTPLATILTSSQLLERYFDKINEDKRAHYFDTISAQMKHLTLMLEDMSLALSGEHRPLEPNSNQIDVTRLCRHLVNELQQNPGGNHTLVFTGDELPKQAGIDPYLLRYILRHLLVHAIRYSPQGAEILLGVSANDESLVFTVSDKGNWILPGEEQRLFQTIGRGRSGSERSAGLGLKIATKCVELQQGTITAENNPDAGVTFTVRLPIPRQAHA